MDGHDKDGLLFRYSDGENPVFFLKKRPNNC